MFIFLIYVPYSLNIVVFYGNRSCNNEYYNIWILLYKSVVYLDYFALMRYKNQVINNFLKPVGSLKDPQ